MPYLNAMYIKDIKDVKLLITKTEEMKDTCVLLDVLNKTKINDYPWINL